MDVFGGHYSAHHGLLCTYPHFEDWCHIYNLFLGRVKVLTGGFNHDKCDLSYILRILLWLLG